MNVIGEKEFKSKLDDRSTYGDRILRNAKQKYSQ